MHNFSKTATTVIQTRFIPILSIVTGILLISYIALFAFVMTYAAMQMRFAESVRDTSAHVGVLESKYLGLVAKTNQINPTKLGYVKPASIAYVTNNSQPTISMLVNY